MNNNIAEQHSVYARANYQNIGLIAGPAVFALMMLFDSAQQTMPIEAWRTAAVGMWMAIWWATEAIPVPVTAFIPLVAFDVLGISSLKEAAEPYSNPIIYLYLGAFLLAIAVERWNLHKRMALMILTRTGTDGRRLVAGFMMVAAFLSMWMTNTSTTMMLMPICLSVVKVITDHSMDLNDKQKADFQVSMLLGLAYGATIGGLATLVGTPPNALLAAFMKESYGVEIGFATWMAVGVPVMLLMLPLTWIVLTRLAFKINIQENPAVQTHLKKIKGELGSMGAAEKRVAIVFFLVILAWILRRPLTALFGIEGVSDTGIVMVAALLLFLLPSGSKEQEQLLTWHDANRVPWGVLVLFGGGLSLAAAVSDSGLALWLGESLAPLGSMGVIALVIAATGLVIFLTELTSNLATAATFLPVMGAIAIQTGIDPLMLSVPITLAASCAFMLPVATPPNAIVFASGAISIPQMIRGGLLLNIVGMFLLAIVAIWWAPYVFA
ncbi:SLC13 family permease [Neptunicella sp. SCSIO 80796]|uniref:SLC13 family permease n=1 Tax=Neptunicella plasticusilytica TaxID=3117012 RepID=UPI003A4DD123